MKDDKARDDFYSICLRIAKKLVEVKEFNEFKNQFQAYLGDTIESLKNFSYRYEISGTELINIFCPCWILITHHTEKVSYSNQSTKDLETFLNKCYLFLDTKNSVQRNYMIDKVNE